ncbi:WD40/YVTN/BNR-like repeat-containing protein [Alkalihalobacterium alkalinitrilicum]|uniref:WD40/YVTN/BNR-like repeat-containing protein n=1 Tax=Alkalihalobacterium alkalinitrilicum TaxID=427920 RepID=UPI000994F7BD|nr:hypothetical protein [Alkalihalobacterium alkalinitrilicum]
MNTMKNTFRGGTAVCKDQNGEYIVAIEREGVYRLVGNRLTSLFPFPFRIVKLIKVCSILYAVGEKGVFLKSWDGGKTWEHKFLPTTTTIWSVVGNSRGIVITHGNNCLFFSYDFGDTWCQVQPFVRLKDNQPSVRSLCLLNNFLFIGTKIHRTYGGIWKLDLSSLKMSWVKKEMNSMVSSIIVYENYLLVAGGSCKGTKGKIEYCSLLSKNNDYFWNEFEQVESQASFLDVTEDNGFIYVTSSQGKDGYATVSRIHIENNIVVPCNKVRGHGWRIANHNQHYVVAGHYETIHSNQIHEQATNRNSNLKQVLH